MTVTLQMFFLIVLPGAPHPEHLGPLEAADLTPAARVCEAARAAVVDRSGGLGDSSTSSAPRWQKCSAFG